MKIFIATDAASGAANEYPGHVSVTMIPERFASEAERDAFFDKMVTDFHAGIAELEHTAESKCSSGNAEFCRIHREKLEEAKGDRLERIERYRAEALVGEES